MDGFLAAVEGSAIAEALRYSRWGYAALSGIHVLGIALLIGSSVPMSVRMLGGMRGIDPHLLVRVLRPFAATGLGVAVVSGALLFSVRAIEYAAMDIFLAKLVLVGGGAASALVATRQTPPRHPKIHAAISLACWPGALACGRSIGFVL